MGCPADSLELEEEGICCSGNVNRGEGKVEAAKQRGRGDEGGDVISLGGRDDRRGADEGDRAAARG